MPLHAQLLKKFWKKTDNRVENNISNKMAAKSAEEAENSLEYLMEMQLKNNGLPPGYEKVPFEDIPDFYEFEWYYVLQMETKEGFLTANYLLKKDASSFGFKYPHNEHYMVVEPSNNLNILYVNSGGNKKLLAYRLTDENTTARLTAIPEAYQFKKIGKESILGYECTGYQAENAEKVITIFITTEANISFNDIYKTKIASLPAGFDPGSLQDGKGLMMKMIIEGKKNAKGNATMTCTVLEKKPFSLYKRDYNGLAAIIN